MAALVFFVGNDLAVYTFDKNQKTLTKYSSPFESAQVQIDQTIQPSQDWELIKSKVLSILSDMSTLKYRGSGQDRHGTYTVEGKEAPGQSYSIKSYENGLIWEDVFFNNTYCYRTNNSEWICSPGYSTDFSVSTANVVTATSTLTGYALTESGSRLENLDGKQYYLFFIEETYTGTENQAVSRSEIYFDPATLYPVFSISTNTVLVNNTVVETSTSKIELYDFNVPVEITLPQ